MTNGRSVYSFRTAQNVLHLGTLHATNNESSAGKANNMELDPTVIPIGAEIRSQSGDLLGRAREVHTRYLILEAADGSEVEIPVGAIRHIEGKRVIIDDNQLDEE